MVLQIASWNILDHTAVKYMTLGTPVVCRDSSCGGPDFRNVVEKNYRDRYGDIIKLIEQELVNARPGVDIICLQEVHVNFKDMLERRMREANWNYQLFFDLDTGLLSLFRKNLMVVRDRDCGVVQVPSLRASWGDESDGNDENMTGRGRNNDRGGGLKIQVFKVRKLDQGGVNKNFYVVNTHFPGKPGKSMDYARGNALRRIVGKLKRCWPAGQKFSMLLVGDLNQPGAHELFGTMVEELKDGTLVMPRMDPSIATSYHRFQMEKVGLVGGLIGGMQKETWEQKPASDWYTQIDYLIHSSDWNTDDGGHMVLPSGGMVGYETPYRPENYVELELYFLKGGKEKPKFVDNFKLNKGGWLSDHALIRYVLN